MNHDGVSVTALMVLVAFAVERVTAGMMFLLSCSRRWRGFLAGSGSSGRDSGTSQRRYKFVSFLFAGAFAAGIVLLNPKMRVLSTLDMDVPAVLDICLTWLVLVAGADRIGDLVGKEPAGVESAPPKPLVIEGTVTLKEEERSRSKVAA